MKKNPKNTKYFTYKSGKNSKFQREDLVHIVSNCISLYIQNIEHFENIQVVDNIFIK